MNQRNIAQGISVIQPNRWSCLPTALAITICEMKYGCGCDYHIEQSDFDKIYKEIIDYIGHDGSEIIPQLEHLGDPYMRRCFHLQEIIDAAYNLGYIITSIECRPMLSNQKEPSYIKEVFPRSKEIDRCCQYMKENNAILIGRTKSNKGHALAWICENYNDKYQYKDNYELEHSYNPRHTILGYAIDPTTGERVLLETMWIESICIVNYLR